jgi:hypothetical protein
MDCKVEYTYKTITIEIDLTSIQTNPNLSNYLFFLQDEECCGHLLILSDDQEKSESKSCYEFGKHIQEYKNFQVQVIKNVNNPCHGSIKEILDIIFNMDNTIEKYYYLINLLENHPDMKEWNNIFRSRYMQNIEGSIAFCFDRKVKESNLFLFFDEVYSVMGFKP